MPLIGLLSPLDSPEQISAWSFAHARDHDDIDRALAQIGTVSPSVPLDPMPTFDRVETWLLLHQTKHTTMNTALQLDGGNLTQFNLAQKNDLDAFAGDNYSEHDAVYQTFAARGVQVGG